MTQYSDAEPLYQPFARMADEQVVVHARNGCRSAIEYLLDRYRSVVEGKARAFFIPGADRDDVIQEGMIGLFKAIRDFSQRDLSPFRSFAELCITRQIITAIKGATRRKHGVLNKSISMDAPVGDDNSERTRRRREILVDAVCDRPEAVVAGRDFRNQIREKIQNDLSELERRVLVRYLRGKSYSEIASALQLTTKQVDNALLRAKRKLQKCARALGALSG